jgi:hypothetical protein
MYNIRIGIVRIFILFLEDLLPQAPFLQASLFAFYRLLRQNTIRIVFVQLKKGLPVPAFYKIM